MNWFPIFIRLAASPVLVVGGGPVALRKARQLLSAGAKVTLVSPEITDGFDALIASGEIEHLRREFDPALVQGRRIVIAATDDAKVNSNVAEAASARGILVNVVDTPNLCDFITPAIVDRDGMTIAIGSDGLAPILVREVKSLIEAMVPRELGRLAGLMGRWRDAVRSLLPS
ncbi:MAG: precorrin-2 dehydrogenase/sirohydrochlorin ferrochelatase family protein, partial [Candidatus Binataceae bacterium]